MAPPGRRAGQPGDRLQPAGHAMPGEAAVAGTRAGILAACSRRLLGAGLSIGHVARLFQIARQEIRIHFSWWHNGRGRDTFAR